MEYIFSLNRPYILISQAKAVRARVPNQRLFYCALDYRGAQEPGADETPHIIHWGFQRAALFSGGGSGEAVRNALARQQRLADSARRSLAFLTEEVDKTKAPGKAE